MLNVEKELAELLDWVHLIKMVNEFELEIQRRVIYDGRPWMLMPTRLLKNYSLEQLEKGFDKYKKILNWKYGK